ncbi:MAG: efflux RND transporter permease subunit [Opitutales bacterium]|nr:efflux RND transporter permease subunit [Opitutales bacterium]
MHALSAWFIRNPVAANLLMGLALIGGWLTLQSIRIEGFPALPPSSVTVTTLYPGASAEQVDRGVSRRIEKALEGSPGIKKVTSLSSESVSLVTVQKNSGFDFERFQNEVTTRVDSIYNLPRDAERPIVTRDEFTVEALLVQVYGDVEPLTLQRVARDMREELLAHPKIEKVDTFGMRSYEIRVEVDDDLLRMHGLSLHDVASAVDMASLDYRTGSIRSESGRVVVRADEKAFDYEEFASIPLKTFPNGARLLVKDVGEVIDGFVEETSFARFQQAPSVGIQLYTSKKGHLIEISEAAHEIVERMRPQLPKGIELDIWGEYSVYMKDRLQLLATNAWQGLLIVFGLLAVFLNLRLAFWVAIGIPISVAGTLIVMGDRFLGHSLNDITTFGMIVVLGLLVDDAIVVGESVFDTRQRERDAIKGTIRGVNRVSTATVFGCFTTVAAFFPLLLIDNDLGKVMAAFALVVIVALLVSLVESKLILPAHLAAIKLDGDPSPKPWARAWRSVQSFASRILDFLNERLYQPLLKKSLRHRYAALTVFVTVAICSMTVLSKGWVRTVFFPEVPGQIISVTLNMNSGSPLNLTLENVSAIEKHAEELNVEAMAGLKTDEPPIARIMTALIDETSAVIIAELQPEKLRKIETMETLRLWRDRVGELEGVEELNFSGTEEMGGGFVVALGARDAAMLEEAVERFSRELEKIEGVYDIRDNLRQGSPQIRLHLKPEAQHLGLTTADLARQIGDAFGGLEVQRMQRGADEVKVKVGYLRERRQHVRDIMDTRIQTAKGEWVPLPLVATVESGYVPANIFREDGKRQVYVEANLDKKVVSPSEVFFRIKTTIMPQMQKLYPQLEIKGVGELEEMGEIRGGLKRALIMIAILIYALLAVPLKSYSQPFVIMSVAPFSFVGAVVGHWVMGFPLSVLSFFGMLAVMGIVVNDSLVMITRFNQIREEGTPIHEALVIAGSSRFRAILLTTITTVCGLLPLLSETSEQAQYLIPAAVSLAWGELLATPVTLLIVPLLIAIGSDVRSLFGPRSKR